MPNQMQQNANQIEQTGLPAGQEAGDQAAAVDQAANPTRHADNFNAATLARVPENEQKQMLGEKLYPVVLTQCRGNQDDAGKVTGMILELENDELLQSLNNPDMIRDKVSEA